MKSTMVELVAELEALNMKSEAAEKLIAEAKAGEYHDYKNKMYAMPKAALVKHLRIMSTLEWNEGKKDKLLLLANRVIEGEFDEFDEALEGKKTARKSAVVVCERDDQLWAQDYGKSLEQPDYAKRIIDK